MQLNVLGGLWFGMALFICWTQGARKGEGEAQVRVLTVLIGSALTILLAALAGALVSWPPPVHMPGLANLFPDYLVTNPNTNSFPSQSTALYSCVAAGVYSLHKTWGWVLWVLVPVCVALPRMYVGGHFMTDVLAGFLLAVIGYTSVRNLLESRLISKIEPLLGKRHHLQWLRDVLIFIWILQVSVEFKDLVWFKKVLESTTSLLDR